MVQPGKMTLPGSVADEQSLALIEQFESAWQKTLDSLSPLDVDSFLQQTGRDAPPEIRQTLQAIEQEYRRRLASRDGTQAPWTDETIVRPPQNSAIAESQETTTLAPNAVSGTDRFAPTIDLPASGTAAQHGASDETLPPPGDGAQRGSLAETLPPQGAEETDPAYGAPTIDLSSAEQRGKSPQRIAAVAGYEILGELGRGGMGVVYRARQQGLNRLVALKMILAGGHADSQHLARFRAEAEAVAQLQHPNIVQIYDIGEQDGLPFFSLEFVDGKSLEQEWDGKPLKPANVLLDRAGVPKVTDFGLVKRIEEGESGQTKTGAIMGTPSYMAPEQAWGKKDVGPLADVYALGAVLYALATGRPPFLGPTPLETVMQLRTQEPVPPSRLLPQLPRDLETICLKCLQKDPAKRYGSAGELADDLRRFQSGEPILARPVGRVERAWRWCRRNPSLAISGGVAAALALCLMIGGPVAAVAINEQKAEAVEARELAEENEQIAVENEDKARAAQAKADENAEIAGSQRDLAVIALNTLVERVPGDLRNVPGTQQIKRDLLLTAMDGMNKIADTGGEQGKDIVMARAHAKMGEVLLEIGEAAPAQQQFQRSHEILAQLVRTERDTPPHVHQLRLGRSYRNLGKAAERLQGAQAAEALYEKSLHARQEALATADDPLFVKQELAESYGSLGQVALSLGKPEQAMEYFRQGVAYRDEWLTAAPGNESALREQAGARLALGHGHLDLGDPEEAQEHYREALEILKKIADDAEANITDRANVALCYDYLGAAFLLGDKPDRAKENYEEAVPRLEALCQEAPRFAALKRKLAKTHYGLGVSLQELGEDAAARKHLERSLELRKQLAEGEPKDIGFQQDLALSLARIGKTDEATQIAEKLLEQFPEEPSVLYIVASTYAISAATAEQTGDGPPVREQHLDKAVEALQQAIEHGYQGAALIQMDPDLAPLADRDDFRNLIDQLQKRS